MTQVNMAGQRILGLSRIHPYWWPGHPMDWWTVEDCGPGTVEFVERVGYRILESGILGRYVSGGHAATYIIRIGEGSGIEDYLADIGAAS